MSAHIALAYRTGVFWHRDGTLRHSDTLSAICLSRPPGMNFPATSPDIYQPGNRDAQERRFHGVQCLERFEHSGVDESGSSLSSLPG